MRSRAALGARAVADEALHQRTATPSGAGAVVFDGGTTTKNVRTARSANQSPIDDTKNGIVNLGSDTTGVTTGVVADYGANLGGDQNQVTAAYGTVSGLGNTASGTSSVAMGQFSTASSGSATAIGDTNTASGGSSTALGSNCVASGSESVAIGVGCSASGGESVAIGNNSSATDVAAVAIGNACTASGNSSTALGNATTASGVGALSAGSGTHSTGGSSVAFGLSSTASGDATIVAGNSCAGAGTACLVTGTGASGFVDGLRAHSGFGTQGQSFDTTYVGSSANAVAANLVDAAGHSLTLRNGYAYTIRARVIAARIDAAQAPSCFEHQIMCHTNGGTLVIDDDTATRTVNTNAYAIAFTAPGGLVLRASLTGVAATTVRAAVQYDVVEVLGTGS